MHSFKSITVILGAGELIKLTKSRFFAEFELLTSLDLDWRDLGNCWPRFSEFLMQVMCPKNFVHLTLIGAEILGGFARPPSRARSFQTPSRARVNVPIIEENWINLMKGYNSDAAHRTYNHTIPHNPIKHGNNAPSLKSVLSSWCLDAAWTITTIIWPGMGQKNKCQVNTRDWVRVIVFK